MDYFIIRLHLWATFVEIMHSPRSETQTPQTAAECGRIKKLRTFERSVDNGAGEYQK